MKHLDYFNIANECHKEGNVETAVQMYIKAINTDPGFGPAYINLANIYKDRSDTQNELGCLNNFLNCPLTGRTIDLLEPAKKRISELTTPVAK